jgi:hypothetical protein
MVINMGKDEVLTSPIGKTIMMALGMGLLLTGAPTVIGNPVIGGLESLIGIGILYAKYKFCEEK